MSVGPLQLLLIVLLVVLIFGTKKLGNVGSDLGKAIRGFKKGLSDGDEDKDTSAEREKLKADEPEHKAGAETEKSGSDKSA